MASAQKRGFRFPWGGDARRDEPATDPHDEAFSEGSLAERLGGADDLGGGPFGLTGGTAVATPEADAPTEDALGGEVSTDAAPVDLAPVDEASLGEAPDIEASQAWPESDRRRTATPAATESSSETAEPTEAPAAAAATATASPPRANPLVAGLVRAMRDAAKTARDEAVAAMRTDAAGRADAIRARSAATAGDLKRAAETDVAAVKEWSRAELARVREETDARIAARRTQLVAETEAAAKATEDLLGQLHATVGAFEAEMAGFFEALLAEEDPARLAGLAERMPSAPGLDAFPASDQAAEVAARPRRATPKAAAPKAGGHREPASPPADAPPVETPIQPTTDATGEAAMPAASVVPAESAMPAEPPMATEDPAHEADIDADAPLEAEAPLDAAEPQVADAEAQVADAEAQVADAGTDPRLGWLDHLDADAAAAAEAAALAGLDRQTNIIVSGLSSVGGIAAFKGALMHVEGVSAVSVTAGTNNDVLFTVTHDGQTELRDAVRNMEPFETRLIADDGDSLILGAREPAA